MICLSKNKSDPFINDFAKGNNFPIVDCVDIDTPEPIIFRSIVKKELITYSLENNLPFYYMDSGYFGNYKTPNNPFGKKLWVRIVKNGLQHNYIKNVPDDRWKKHFNYNLKEQSKSGNYILLVLPSEKPCKFYGINLDEWIQTTINQIKQYSDREIKIRKKPQTRSARLTNSIFDDLENCWATVTYNSIAAVESVMSGVPAFTLAPTAADPVCDKDLSKLESPTYQDMDKLYKWVCHLSYGQFHINELKNGKALRILKDYESS